MASSMTSSVKLYSSQKLNQNLKLHTPDQGCESRVKFMMSSVTWSGCHLGLNVKTIFFKLSPEPLNRGVHHNCACPLVNEDSCSCVCACAHVAITRCHLLKYVWICQTILICINMRNYTSYIVIILVFVDIKRSYDSILLSLNTSTHPLIL